MNILLQYFIFFLELLESFIYTKISGIYEKNTKEIIRKPIFKLVPYHILIHFINLEKYNYYLVKNGKYFYNKNTISISPPILKITLNYKLKESNVTLNETLDVTNIFNCYQNTFPLWLVINNESLNHCQTITIKKQSILSEEEIELDVNQNEDLTLSKIYNK